jgi:multidrug efflux system outer membrane protein
MRNLLSVSMAAALMVGCAPMKEATTAKVDASVLPISNKMQVDLPEWQSFFPDAQLKVLIDAALSNNRDLRVAAARISETRAQYGIARADRFPSVDMAVGATRSSTPASISPSGKRFDLTKGEVGVSLPSYELDLWGRISSLSEAALATFLSSEANAKAVQLAMIGDIANAYYQLLELEDRANLLSSTKDNRAQWLALMEKRVDVGLANDADRLQAQAVVDGLVRDLVELKRQHSLVQNTLSVLIGVPLNSLKLPDALPLRQQADTSGLRTDTPSLRLLQRPDVQAAELRLKAANANIEAARAAFLPRIALTASYGTASNELNGLFANNSESWSFVPQITLPIFNSGRTQANLDVAAARQVSAVADYEKTLQNAFRDVADALVNRTSYDVQIVSQQAVLSSQKERLRLATLRYQRGLTGYIDVLDAQRDYQTAEQQLVSLVRAQKVAEVAVFKALGGGV